MKTLLERTLELLHASDQSVPQIAAATNTKPRWLLRLIAGDYSNPGVNAIERIHKYLLREHTRKKRKRA